MILNKLRVADHGPPSDIARNRKLFQRFTLGSEILGQLALHVSHIGFLWNSSPVRETVTTYDSGGSPLPTRFSDDDTAELLEQAAAAGDMKPDWPADVP